MRHIKCLLLITFFAFSLGHAFAKQKKSKNTAELTCDYKKLSGNEYDLIFKVNLKKGLYVKANNDYDTLEKLKMPTFTFDPNSLYKLEGEIASKGLIETKKIKHKGIVNLYTYTVLYNQKITAEPGTIIKGTYQYQICTDTKAKHPKIEKFSITVK